MTESGISKMWRAMIEKGRPPADLEELPLWLAKNDLAIAQMDYSRAVSAANEAYQELLQRTSMVTLLSRLEDERNLGGRSVDGGLPTEGTNDSPTPLLSK